MCQFNISFSGNAENLVQRARQAIEGAGGAFAGDVAQGNFKAKTPIGSIGGSYQIEGQQISLAITKKPLLLSCSKIQKEFSSMIS